jgi:hypothetical protein
MQFTDRTFRPYATSVVGQQGSARSATACPDWDAARSFLALYWAEVAPIGSPRFKAPGERASHIRELKAVVLPIIILPWWFLTFEQTLENDGADSFRRI